MRPFEEVLAPTYDAHSIPEGRRVGQGSKALLVICGHDMLRDVGHAYARPLAADGNDLACVHCPDLPHGTIQMTAHAQACLKQPRRSRAGPGTD